jgi:hypothetical protein
MSQSWNRQPWHDVALFESLDAAQILETYLRDHGFEARAYDDKWFRYFLFLRPPRITYHVQVRMNHVAAVAKLRETEPPAILAKAMHCPACSSLHVNYPQMTRRFVLPTMLLHLGIIFRVIDHQCYCEHCHNMWTLSGDKRVHKERVVRWFPF